GRQSFHFRHHFVSKHPSADLGASPAAERGLGRPGRVYLYPARGERGAAKALGGRYDQVARRYWVPRASVVSGGRAGMRQVARLRTQAKRSGWAARQVGQGRAAAKSAAEFALYVGRSDLVGEAREAEIVSDEQGEILFGNMTDDPRAFEELRTFWNRVVE